MPILLAAGEVTDTSAIIWARGVEPGDLAVDVRSLAGRPAASAVIRGTTASDLAGQARVDGLTPATRHRYTVRGGGRGAEGKFTTAPRPSDPAPVRLLWGADLGSRGHCRPSDGEYAIVRAMAARKPDLLVLAGDTVYADHHCHALPPDAPGAMPATTLDQFHAKHRHNRAGPAVQQLLRATPVLATWDDHEVRNNFAGEHGLAAVGRRAFLDYWPVAALPSLVRSARWGRLLELFLIDTRSHRDRACRPDGPGKSMLGAAQRRWLVDAVADSGARGKAIVSSVPLSIPKAWPCGESWAPTRVLFLETGFSRERDLILAELARRRTRNVVVLAGDVHFAAITTLRPAPGLVVHELIAGPLAAATERPRAPDARLAPVVRFSRGGLANFGEVEIDEEGLTVRILDAGGRALATERFRADEALSDRSRAP